MTMSMPTANPTDATAAPSPGAAAEAFSLEPPAAVSAVPPEAASGRIRLKPEELDALDAQVLGFIDDITAHDSQHPKFKEAVDRIHQMGNREIEASAAVSNRMLDRPLRTLDNGLFDKGSEIGQSLIALRRQIEALDPARHGAMFSRRRRRGARFTGSVFKQLVRHPLEAHPLESGRHRINELLLNT